MAGGQSRIDCRRRKWFREVRIRTEQLAASVGHLVARGRRR
jgi:hypothetical protein